MATIGFVGLGDMGGPIVGHLADADHDVRAFDIDEQAVADAAAAGATPGDSSADAAAGAELIFLSLPDPETVEAVTGEIADVLEPGSTLVDLTTSRPAVTNAIAEAFAERDVTVLGAPISGGKHGAAAGELAIMVGGDEETYESYRSVFEAFAPETFYVGEAPGDGHAVKLLNNFLSYTALVATSEAVIVGRLAGLDPDVLVDVFSASTGYNSATDDKIPNQVLSGDYDTGFPLALTEKDIRLFAEFVEDQETTALLGNTTRQLVGYARAAEGDDGDMTRVYDFLESVMVRSYYDAA